MPADYVTLSATSFIDGLGVNTHLPYTDGQYNSVSQVIADLQYLGISNVRDGISNGAGGSASISHYISLAQAGVDFTFLIGNQVTDNSAIEAVLNEIAQVESAVPGSVLAVEGVNEVNNYPVTFDGMTGLSAAVALQQDLYADVKADPALSGVAVDYFTGWGDGSVAMGPDVSTTAGLADYDTQHPYPLYNQAPEAWVNREKALPNANSAVVPAVYTETGYSSNDVSPYVQEVYTLDLLMDTAQQGISQTYLYDLMDAYAPGSVQGDDGFGLFDYTGAAKPVAVGIHDLTSILTQTVAGSSMPANGVSFSVSGLPSTGQAMELTKSDSADVIAVWAEPQLWNDTTSSQMAAPTESVTITLDGYYATLAVYDPVDGTAAVETVHDADQIVVSVSDHPVLVEVSGGDPPPPGNALCFTAGTRIAVPGGEVPVESLEPGRLVMTPSGPAPVHWIGRRHYDGQSIAGNHLMLPVCIRRGALADNVPCRDLWVSPGHGIWQEDALVPAWRLVNDVSILQPQQTGQVLYYHIELGVHGLVFAEGCAAESYLDDGSRNLFVNAAEAPATIAPMRALPRLENGFQLQHIRQRVNARAGLVEAEQGLGELRGFVDVAGPHCVAGWAQDVSSPEAPVCLEILLDGKFLTWVLANAYRPDLRAAGLGSGAHGFELTLPHPGEVVVRRAQDKVSLPPAAVAERRAA